MRILPLLTIFLFGSFACSEAPYELNENDVIDFVNFEVGKTYTYNSSSVTWVYEGMEIKIFEDIEVYVYVAAFYDTLDGFSDVIELEINDSEDLSKNRQYYQNNENGLTLIDINFGSLSNHQFLQKPNNSKHSNHIFGFSSINDFQPKTIFKYPLFKDQKWTSTSETGVIEEKSLVGKRKIPIGGEDLFCLEVQTNYKNYEEFTKTEFISEKGLVRSIFESSIQISLEFPPLRERTTLELISID